MEVILMSQNVILHFIRRLFFLLDPWKKMAPNVNAYNWEDIPECYDQGFLDMTKKKIGVTSQQLQLQQSHPHYHHHCMCTYMFALAINDGPLVFTRGNRVIFFS